VRKAARHPPVIDPWRGQAELQTPLAGLRNAYATMTHRPIVQAGQNKTPGWRWRQSGRTCVALPLNRQTPAIA